MHALCQYGGFLVSSLNSSSSLIYDDSCILPVIVEQAVYALIVFILDMFFMAMAFTHRNCAKINAFIIAAHFLIGCLISANFGCSTALSVSTVCAISVVFILSRIGT